MLVVLAFVLLIVLPSPWNVVGFGVCLVLFPGEVFGWHRTVRGNRRQVGAETLIGATGIAIDGFVGDGQIRLNGAIWAAHSERAVAAGATVSVVGREELVLMVEPQ